MSFGNQLEFDFACILVWSKFLKMNVSGSPNLFLRRTEHQQCKLCGREKVKFKSTSDEVIIWSRLRPRAPVQNQQTRETALEDVTQTQQESPELPLVTLITQIQQRPGLRVNTRYINSTRDTEDVLLVELCTTLRCNYLQGGSCRRRLWYFCLCDICWVLINFLVVDSDQVSQILCAIGIYIYLLRSKHINI